MLKIDPAAIAAEMAGKITQERAVEIAGTSWWKSVDPKVVARAQLGQQFLCMDWSAFQEAIAAALGRPVWTHEFARADDLRAELDGLVPTLDMQGVVNKAIDLLGADKVAVVRT